MSEYREVSKHFNSESILEKFEVLEAVGKIYTVPPENLKVLTSETKLAKMDKQDILTFVKLRSDFKPQWLRDYLDFAK